MQVPPMGLARYIYGLLRQIFLAHAIKTEENAGPLFQGSPMYQIIGKLITHQQLPARSHLIHTQREHEYLFCPHINTQPRPADTMRD